MSTETKIASQLEEIMHKVSLIESRTRPAISEALALLREVERSLDRWHSPVPVEDADHALGCVRAAMRILARTR